MWCRFLFHHIRTTKTWKFQDSSLRLISCSFCPCFFLFHENFFRKGFPMGQKKSEIFASTIFRIKNHGWGSFFFIIYGQVRQKKNENFQDSSPSRIFIFFSSNLFFHSHKIITICMLVKKMPPHPHPKQRMTVIPKRVYLLYYIIEV